MFNQICIAGLVQALAEGINFAEKAGLDVERALDVIGKGAAQSWQMDNRGRTMVADKFDFGFAVDWMRKDLSLCLAEARANGAALPVTALVDQFYARVQAQGGGRWDSSSLIRVLRNPRVVVPAHIRGPRTAQASGLHETRAPFGLCRARPCARELCGPTAVRVIRTVATGRDRRRRSRSRT